MKRILSLLTLLVAFALVQAQSNYGTTVIFNPQNPDIPGAGGYYPEDKTLILDGIGDKDADAYVEGICSRLSKVHQMDYSEFCEAVRQVVIVGEFTSDNSREIISAVTNYFPSLDVMDLSRMAGDFAEKTYFMHEILKHLILPEQVSSIGSFFFCENLTEITCYAATPPVIMGYSMWGEEQEEANPFKDPGKVTIYVPDASVELYKASAQWGKAQIEPIGDSVYRLRVNLPHGIEAENYRNMNLVLTHDTDGQQTRYVLSARTNYNFAGLKDANQGTWNVAVYSRAGGCLSSLRNIKIENKVTEVTLPAFPALQTVCAKVNTSALPSSFGTTPETMCQISWFDVYDNLLATGKEVAGVIAGDQVKVQVIPSKSMQKFCHLPSVQTYTVTAGTNQAEVCLEPFREVKLKCVVLDSITRIPLGDYDFHSIRCYDGSDKSFYYKYDRGYFQDGKNRFGPFEITIPEGEYDYTVNLNGYKYAKRYLNTYTMAKDGVLDMEVLLEPGEPNYINANVTMNCTYATELEYQVAIIPNANDPLETGNTFKSYDLSTARISIYDVTQEREVNDVFPIASLFSAIGLPDWVKVGDVLRVTASAFDDSFIPVTMEKVLSSDKYQNAFSMFTKEKSGITLDFRQASTSRVISMLFDADGELLRTARYGKSELSFDHLDNGDYTVITMCEIPNVINSITQLEDMESLSLVEGEDYIRNDVNVDGQTVFPLVTNDYIPLPNAQSQKICVNSTTTSLTRDVLIQGSYTAFRTRIRLTDEILNDHNYSNFRFQFKLPKYCSILEGSFLINGQPVSYQQDDRRITADINDIVETGGTADVRFCLVPEKVGKYKASAFIGYDYGSDEEAFSNTLGAVSFEATDNLINIPDYSIDGTLSITGLAPVGSTITLYDGESAAASMVTTSEAFLLHGTLNNPTNLSVHLAYVKIETEDGRTFHSPMASVQVDKDHNQPKQVKMIYPNAYSQKDEICIWDFLNPEVNETSYDYYPESKDFTFLIDFVRNDTTEVQNLHFSLQLNGGGTVNCRTVFDEELNCWVARYSTLDSNFEQDLPVNVEVGYDFVNVERQTSRQEFDETQNDVATSVQEIQQMMDILRDCNTDNIEQKLAELEAIDGSFAISAASQAEADQLWDELMALPEDQFMIEAERIYQEIVEYEASLGDDFGSELFSSISSDGNLIQLGDSITIETRDCSGFDRNNMLDSGYQKITMDDGSDLYFYDDDQQFIVVDFKKDKATIITYLQVGAPRKVFSVSKDVADFNEKAMGVLDKIQGIYGDLMGISEKMIKHNSDVVTKIEKDIAIAQKFANNPDKSPFFQTSYKVVLAKLQVKYGIAQTMKSVALKTPNLVKKCLPVLSYALMIGDLAKRCNTINGIVQSIPDPCEHDQANALALVDQAHALIGAATTFLLTKIVVQAIADGTILGGILGSGASGGASLLASLGAFAAKTAINLAADWAYGTVMDEGTARLSARKDALKCTEEEEPEPETFDPGVMQPRKPSKLNYPGYPSVNPLIDPSGFVCEAVESNRLPGVTATCYTKRLVEDAYGDKTELTTIWDAENYGQQNPLITDAKGMYSWMVPAGTWQVAYDMEGYEAQRSEWLPVPPPQLDVNVGLVRNEQPVVQRIAAYEQGIDIEFSLYMRQAMLTSATVAVEANGKALQGTLEALNSEEAFSDHKTLLASRFRFTPNTPLKLGAAVTLTVKGAVQAYNGIALAEDVRTTLIVEPEITSVGIEEGRKILVPYKGTHQVTIAAVSPQAAAYKKLSLHVISSDIASAETELVTLDKEGKAYITLSGKLPGTTYLQYSIDGTALSVMDTIRVVYDDLDVPMPPKASVISGTYVNAGAAIELTAQEGCTIWYTLDGSCPCDETKRIRYTGPITISHDTVLRAMAISATGQESESVRYVWFLSTGINDVQDNANADVYNVQGIKLNKPHKGINIMRGKKVMVNSKAVNCTGTL